MKTAFLLIGHSNWGKSETLYHLTGKDRRKKYIKIEDEWFVIRRMSNDDDEESMKRFIKSASKYQHHLIIAFCPTFETGTASELLEELSKNFMINAFVLTQKHDGTDSIKKEDIEALKKFGKVGELENMKEAVQRAKAFKEFIIENL